MEFDKKQNSLKYWDNIHSEFERSEIKLDDWLDRFESIINNVTEDVINI